MLCQPHRGCVCQNHCCRLPRICGSKIKVPKITNPWPKSLSLLFFACQIWPGWIHYLLPYTYSCFSLETWFSTTVIYKLQYLIFPGGKWSWPSVRYTPSHNEPPGRSFHTLYLSFVGMALQWERVRPLKIIMAESSRKIHFKDTFCR